VQRLGGGREAALERGGVARVGGVLQRGQRRGGRPERLLDSCVFFRVVLFCFVLFCFVLFSFLFRFVGLLGLGFLHTNANRKTKNKRKTRGRRAAAHRRAPP
jgi:hypothetical protein